MYCLWLGCFASRKRLVALMLALIGLIFVNVEAIAAPKAKLIEFWNDSEEQSALLMDNSKWSSILKKYVVLNHPSGVNRFNYQAVTEPDKQALNEYIEYMQQMDPRQLNKARQKAYWLNLFNAAIVQEVLEFEPEDSIREVGRGLWRSNRFYIAMQKTSLDNIEHGILRPIFNDPRIHFLLAAGTIGSASIPPEPFTDENLDEMLDKATRDFLNHQRGVSVNGGSIVLSSIFKWYQSDFGGNYESVKRFIIPYVSDEVARALSASGRAKYDYEWGLNKP